MIGKGRERVRLSVDPMISGPEGVRFPRTAHSGLADRGFPAGDPADNRSCSNTDANTNK